MIITMNQAWQSAIDVQQDFGGMGQFTEDSVAEYMAQLTECPVAECKAWILMTTHALPKNATDDDVDALIDKLAKPTVN